MLVTSSAKDGGGHALLGRKAAWPKGRWSTLAGFVEVGERVEECVVRETFEESGVRVDLGSVRFVASQPWPFPKSLMMGFTAQVCKENSERGGSERSMLPAINFDPLEMEDVRWFSREFVAARLQGGSTALEFEPSPSEREFHIPGKASLARILISEWALLSTAGASLVKQRGH
jgi:NADH pyrophosphatase NudC (nudix superfamily)